MNDDIACKSNKRYSLKFLNTSSTLNMRILRIEENVIFQRLEKDGITCNYRCMYTDSHNVSLNQNFKAQTREASLYKTLRYLSESNNQILTEKTHKYSIH